MKQYHLPMKNVKKSNAICRAKWSPENIYEPRIVSILASKIQADDERFKEYEIPFTALFAEKEYGGKDYLKLQNSLKSLVEKSITITEEDGTIKIYPLFYSAELNPNSNSFKIAIHDKLKNHFLNLKQHYTQYNLMEFLTLSSTYSQRLFEYLKSWEDCESTQIKTEELHEILGVPDNYKTNFAQFKRKTLEPALKEINKKTGLNYSWQPVKAKNKIVQIVFLNSKVKKKLPERIKNKIEKAKEAQKVVSEQASFEDLLKQIKTNNN